MGHSSVMRIRKEFLVITFAETSDAIAAEKTLKKQGISGRMIPVPRQLSAGCGLSWRTELQEREAAGQALERAGIHWQQMEPVHLWVAEKS